MQSTLPYYIVICGLFCSTIFFHIISYMAVFTKTLLNIKCVFWFSLQFCLKHLIPRIILRDTIIYVSRSSCKVPVTHQISIKLEFSWQIFDNYSNIKFHENRPIGSRVVPCGQVANGQMDTMKLIVAFHNFANAPKKGRSLPSCTHPIGSVQDLFFLPFQWF
jgi:hypothetical protein